MFISDSIFSRCSRCQFWACSEGRSLSGYGFQSHCHPSCRHSWGSLSSIIVFVSSVLSLIPRPGYKARYSWESPEIMKSSVKYLIKIGQSRSISLVLKNYFLVLLSSFQKELNVCRSSVTLDFVYHSHACRQWERETSVLSLSISSGHLWIPWPNCSSMPSAMMSADSSWPN